MKRYVYVLPLLCMVFLLCGCSPRDKDDQNIQQPHSEQSIWQLLDEDGNRIEYLFENDPDVAAVMTLIQRHIACVDNRSSKDVLFEEESTTYSSDFFQMLRNHDYEEQLKKMYTENQLAISSVTVFWNPSSFNEARDSCKVDVDSVFRFENGTQKYLDSLNVELETEYVEHRIYYCILENDEWKISNIEKSAIYANG